MDQPPKRKQRVVSKGQYAFAQANRLGCGVLGITLFVMAMICAVSSLWDYCLVLQHRIAPYPWYIIATIYWVMACGIGYGAFYSMKRVRTIDPGTPISRISADTLPAEESLVRASAEPAQEQHSVLLRAFTDNQETPAEQLLRPTGEPERGV